MIMKLHFCHLKNDDSWHGEALPDGGPGTPLSRARTCFDFAWTAGRVGSQVCLGGFFGLLLLMMKLNRYILILNTCLLAFVFTSPCGFLNIIFTCVCEDDFQS